jgi:hypothetical protein
MEETVRMAVFIETSRYAISGEVAVPAHFRLSDYVNDREREFFAVTDVRVAPLEIPDQARYVPFILVARHEIGVVMPCEETPPTDARHTAAAHTGPAHAAVVPTR